jgi:uncharacterized protein YraI
MQNGETVNMQIDKMMRVLVLVLMACALAADVHGQADDVFAAQPTRQVNVRSGPGSTFGQVGTIPGGAAVRVTQRNRIGTWLYVQYPRADGSIALQGWVYTGYLALHPALAYSQVYENADFADADPMAYPALSALYSAPVIPRLEGALLEQVRAIFARGQTLGMRADAFTKVGDSLSADPLYMTPMGTGAVELGHYDYLAETVAYYAASAAEPSRAAMVGMATYTMFDPQWAIDAACAPGEGALVCEYRLKRPSIALILFGPNDVMRVDSAYFTEQYRLIVQASLDAGVIPVLSTFSYDENAALWRRSVAFNNAIIALGAEYNVPVINLWLAARPLPAFGLDIDGVHMLRSGATTLRFTRADEAFYGATLRNLLSLRTLHEIRIVLGLPRIDAQATAESTPESTAVSGG